MTVAQMDEIVRIYGRFEEGLRSKIFDNAHFGYTRIAVERPLRLRYQMTTEDKARFLDAYPHLLDDVQAIDKMLGRDVRLDSWLVTWRTVIATDVVGAAGEAVGACAVGSADQMIEMGIEAGGCQCQQSNDERTLHAPVYTW